MTDHPRAPRMNTEPNGVTAMTYDLAETTMPAHTDEDPTKMVVR